MFNYLIHRLSRPKAVQIAPETPVQVWVIKQYKTLFKSHIKNETWAESEFYGMRVEPGEYGVGNPMIIVINAINEQRISGEAIDRNQFVLKYGELPTFSSDHAAADRDAEYEGLLKSVEELRATYNRIMKL